MDRLLNHLLYLAGRTFVWVVQLFPLRFVAWTGRMAGLLAFYLDWRHRRVAVGQLDCFLKHTGRKGDSVKMGREHFQRLGENYLSAVKTSGMKAEALEKHIEFRGIDLFEKPVTPDSPDEWKNGWIIAIGHFGNFELYARSLSSLNGRVGAATYRGLNQPGLNRLLHELRASSGVRFFDRRKEVKALRKLMTDGSVVLGLLGDQSAGSGMLLDFLGDKCLCSTAPAIFSQRYHCRLATGICYRTGPAKWVVEFEKEIPTFANGSKRSVEEVTQDVNTAFEKAIYKDPLNWFWVHDRWKRFKKKRKR
ncbi:MAG: lysophospholipid acyltransferase family protein [Limisphaerales bacterium]|nr:hypothetical protein [Pedosphaera sp.]HAR00626.1 hypothetical protein [Verrucomicrobiales bacterium]HBP56466.1 hypothetical protein [Verrucomicrobiales bacterium]HCP38033.1 hypothetical protein [Verrucomicrobiales bacterium]HCZ03005.1 hypothetical protein [Verrucomicrobiales bacterium]|tara:strand:- start:1847 stop:2764 length:918 start_codon:yes stop_codon:yes gene_type:complete